MEIIMNYIESMFAGVPVTDATKRLREDITANMSDKYEELVKEGKSGNEAIGTVISEFGNIDEVLTEMGVSRVELAPVQTEDPANAHIRNIRIYGVLTGFGAGIIMLGAVLVSTILPNSYSNELVPIGVVSLLMGMVFIIAAVLVRTKLYSYTSGLSPQILTSLRTRAAKNEERNFKVRMLAYIIELVAFTIAGVVDMTWNPGLNAVLLMLFVVAVSFGIFVQMLAETNTYNRFLGEQRGRVTAQKVLSFMTVPILTEFIVLTMFTLKSNGWWGSPAVTLGCFFMMMYMSAFTVARLFDLIKIKNEQLGAKLDSLHEQKPTQKL